MFGTPTQKQFLFDQKATSTSIEGLHPRLLDLVYDAGPRHTTLHRIVSATTASISSTFATTQITDVPTPRLIDKASGTLTAPRARYVSAYTSSWAKFWD